MRAMKDKKDCSRVTHMRAITKRGTRWTWDDTEGRGTTEKASES